MGTETRQRTERLLVRLTPQEIDEIRSKADRYGITAASFVRASCLQKPVPGRSNVPYKARKRAHLFRDSADLLSQLSRVGNNLNQLSKQANEGRFLESVDIRECLRKITDIADQITGQITPVDGGPE